MSLVRWIVRRLQFLIWRLRNRLFPPTPWDGAHHPALLSIEPWKGQVSGKYSVDFLGVRTDPQFRSFFAPSPEGLLRTDRPVPDQTYFEYITLLESIAKAPGPRYTILELGSGYGFWLVSAARALRLRPDLKPHLVGVEMETTRYRRMLDHFRNNDLDPNDHHLLQAAVSDRAGTATYPGEQDAGEDYGLSLESTGLSPRSIEVPAVRLGPMLETHAPFDLLHMDIQGEELKVILDARALIRDKVRHLVVGTHSSSIHRSIRRLLQEDGWELRFDYSGKTAHQTRFGQILFVDGLVAADRSDA